MSSEHRQVPKRHSYCAEKKRKKRKTSDWLYECCGSQTSSTISFIDKSREDICLNTELKSKDVLSTCTSRATVTFKVHTTSLQIHRKHLRLLRCSQPQYQIHKMLQRYSSSISRDNNYVANLSALDNCL